MSFSSFQTNWTFQTQFIGVIRISCSSDYPVSYDPIVQVFCQLSILTIVYSNRGFKLSPLILLVPMSDNLRSPSHHTILCRFHSSPFLTKFILLEMCLLCLLYLPLLDIHKSDLLSNIMRDDYYGTTSGSLFII